ncbi:MAG: hypothetical protein ACI93R_000870 [Flavobacteriales bacterium]|jgi:hypothetical protein
MSKIFIIGLPRTGTTSICIHLLDHNHRVAHNAYCENTIVQADVIADTPVFADYAKLDALYPNSKFIMLERSLELWTPSIQRLLRSMRKVITRNVQVNANVKPITKPTIRVTTAPTEQLAQQPIPDAAAHITQDTIPHSIPAVSIAAFRAVFPNFDKNITLDSRYLHDCYKRHMNAVKDYFINRPLDLLYLDVSDSQACEKLHKFCLIDISTNQLTPPKMPHVNRQRRITYWDSVEHKNKIES